MEYKILPMVRFAMVMQGKKKSISIFLAHNGVKISSLKQRESCSIVFKERQQKSAEGGMIPTFYKKKPEEGYISSNVQRLAKVRFLKKQTDLLLNANDLDAMWVCLRENCVIDDATGAEKIYTMYTP